MELAVFGDKLQQIPGLIASVKTMRDELREIKDIVEKLRDNRMAWLTLGTSGIAAVGAVAAAWIAAAAVK